LAVDSGLGRLPGFVHQVRLPGPLIGWRVPTIGHPPPVIGAGSPAILRATSFRQWGLSPTIPSLGSGAIR
jgi:hypothetical protein